MTTTYAEIYSTTIDDPVADRFPSGSPLYYAFLPVAKKDDAVLYAVLASAIKGCISTMMLVISQVDCQ